MTHALQNTRGGTATTQDAIQQKMAAIERTEEELLIDPASFTALHSRLPDLVDHVD